jgi:hypothetical protein
VNEERKLELPYVLVSTDYIILNTQGIFVTLKMDKVSFGVMILLAGVIIVSGWSLSILALMFRNGIG